MYRQKFDITGREYSLTMEVEAGSGKMDECRKIYLSIFLSRRYNSCRSTEAKPLEFSDGGRKMVISL